MLHFQFYLYNHSVTIYTDHSAVMAILDCPTPTGKHGWWWLKVYAQGVKEVKIIHRSRKTNTNADTLSQNPLSEQSPLEEQAIEPEVSAVNSTEIRGRLTRTPSN